MGWQSVAICDEHWREDNPDGRKPHRVVGHREHCHKPGCSKDGDIFVRAFIDEPGQVTTFEAPQEGVIVKPPFGSVDHALATGALLGALVQVDGFTALPEVDDDSNYTNRIFVQIFGLHYVLTIEENPT